MPLGGAQLSTAMLCGAAIYASEAPLSSTLRSPHAAASVRQKGIKAPDLIPLQWPERELRAPTLHLDSSTSNVALIRLFEVAWDSLYPYTTLMDDGMINML